MKILAVDDEPIQLKLLQRAIRAAVPNCELSAFGNPVQALQWAEKEQPEIAFLDIQMPIMDGIVLGKELKKRYPHINLIFVTGYYEEYVFEAIPLHFSGYLQKPVTEEAVALEMQQLRFPLIKEEQDKLLTVRCFGNFEVFYQGKPVVFSRYKTKELFAFLIDRKGSTCNGATLCSILYENDENHESHKSNLRKCVADLRAVLKAFDAEDVFLKGFDSYAIDPSLLECDYFDWEKNEPYAVRAFHGEYMSQYSWAEETLAGILYQNPQS